MGVIDPFNKDALEKLIAADPKLALFFSMKFTEALEKFGPAPEETITYYDFEANVRETER